MVSLKVGFVVSSVTLAVQELARTQTAYTASEVLTFFAAGGVLVTGLGAVIVNIIVALKTGTKMDASLAKSDEIAGKVQEVHTLTNSNLSAVKAELDKVASQNKALLELVTELRSERDKTAAIAATAFTPQASPQSVPSPTLKTALDSNTDHLEKIEENTDKTAKNTARTDAAVTQLKKKR